MTEPQRLPDAMPAAPRGTGLGPWSRLRELDRLLQGAGLPTGPDRWQNAQDLLAALAAGHRLPVDPRQIRPLLAPLFCRSPEEQRRFAQVFDQWLGMDAPRTTAVAVGPVQPESRPRKAPPQTPLRPILLGLGLLVMALTLGLYLWLEPAPVAPGPKPIAGTTRPLIRVRGTFRHCPWNRLVRAPHQRCWA